MRYKSVFILPKYTTKELTDYGWEFLSEYSVDETVTDEILKLISTLEASAKESDTYKNSELIVNVCRIENTDKIEQIYIRDYSLNRKYIQLIEENFTLNTNIEVFVP